MGEMQLLYNYLVVGALLFGIGLIGFLSRRNMIIMFLAAEMMLQGVSVSLVAWGRFHNDWGGQVLVIFISDRGRLRSRHRAGPILMLFQERQARHRLLAEHPRGKPAEVCRSRSCPRSCIRREIRRN